uniref:uncharacterized protein n=1 Tax=Myxine glutinosa TaxID=7769 RepID=UPI00358F196C
MTQHFAAIGKAGDVNAALLAEQAEENIRIREHIANLRKQLEDLAKMASQGAQQLDSIQAYTMQQDNRFQSLRENSQRFSSVSVEDGQRFQAQLVECTDTLKREVKRLCAASLETSERLMRRGLGPKEELVAAVQEVRRCSDDQPRELQEQQEKEHVLLERTCTNLGTCLEVCLVHRVHGTCFCHSLKLKLLNFIQSFPFFFLPSVLFCAQMRV